MLRLFIGIFLVLLLGYGVIKAYPLLTGPGISLSSPSLGVQVLDGLVRVEGVAHNTETLTLNDAPLLIDETGRFSRELILPSGGAILSLRAEDRFGRTTSITRVVYVP